MHSRRIQQDHHRQKLHVLCYGLAYTQPLLILQFLLPRIIIHKHASLTRLEARIVRQVLLQN